MLALQSKKPAGLGDISMGLDSMETFRKGVGIRVSSLDNNHTGQPVEKLELVFEGDEEGENRGLLKIERSKAYWVWMIISIDTVTLARYLLINCTVFVC
jgi:hypothetical protein